MANVKEQTKTKTCIDKINLIKVKSDIPRARFKQSNEVAEYSRALYDQEIEIIERVYAIFLSRNNETIGYYEVSKGGTVGSTIDIKIIAKIAVDLLSSSVIFVHNHPSGNLKASSSDISVTNRLKLALSFFDITLLEHIILGNENQYLSFADEGFL